MRILGLCMAGDGTDDVSTLCGAIVFRDIPLHYPGQEGWDVSYLTCKRHGWLWELTHPASVSGREWPKADRRNYWTLFFEEFETIYSTNGVLL